ncbi:hypothetical protein LCGC14_1593030 [marine sediment metagenome]|uniref:Polymerase nucleotidyl transferase domain-containing protein n=1 Tax=marine sediment metagenome TaxID=412755 RepID=A0A0F9IDD8_9ZZZZ
MNKLIQQIKDRVQPYGELAYLAFSGSRSYGTHTNESDTDIQGFFVPHLDYIIGIKNVNQVSLNFKNNKGNLVEGQVYSIQKIIKLLSNCNPNVLEMLWVREKDILYKNHVGEKVLNNRNLFLSKRVKHTYGGYAHAQFQRMKRINLNAMHNPKRKERREQFGYDTKNALHLIRLLTMGYEILTEYVVNVWREDRDYLKAILEGKYDFKYISEIAEKKFELLEQTYVTSDLPNVVNYEKISELLKGILLAKIKEEIE